MLVVDDHPAVRLGVLRLLDAEPDMVAVAAGTGTEAVEMAAAQRPDVAVVDYQLGHGEDGLAVTRELRCLAEPPHVLVYSAYADTPLAALAVVAGAEGMVNKADLGGDLCVAIRDVVKGRPTWPVLPKPIIHSIGLRLPWEDRPLFRMWINGASDDDIAATHGLSAQELEAKRRRLLRVLGGPPGRPRLPWDDGSWPLSYARARRLRSSWS